MFVLVFSFQSFPVSDLAPGQMGLDDMKMLEQKAQQLAAEAEQDKPKPKEKILFVRFVAHLVFSQLEMIICIFYETGRHSTEDHEILRSYSPHVFMQE